MFNSVRKTLTFAIAVLLTATFAHAQPSQFVQGSATHWSSTSPQSTPAITVSAGHLLAVCVGWDNTATITAITAGPSSTPVLIDTLAGAVGNLSTYYVPNTTSGSTSITVTWSADPGSGVLSVHEVSGRDTVAPLDSGGHTTFNNVFVGITTDAISSNATAGSATTTANGEYIFGCAFDENVNGGTWTAGATTLTYFKEEDMVNGATEDAIQSTAGQVAAKWTYNTNSRVLAAVVGFKAASGTCTPTMTLLGVGRCG